MYRLIFILLSIIVFSACRSDKQKDDFSFSGIKIARYDRLQYEATVQNSFFSLQRMNTEFAQETRLLIEEVLDLGSVDMVDMNDRLCAYFSDSILVHLMEDVGEKFKDVSSLEQRLTQGFSNLKKEIHVQIAGLIHPRSDVARPRISDVPLMTVEIDKIGCCAEIGRIMLSIPVAGGIADAGVVTVGEEGLICDHIGRSLLDGVRGEDGDGRRTHGRQLLSTEPDIRTEQISTGTGVHRIMSGIKLIGGERQRLGRTNLSSFGQVPSIILNSVICENRIAAPVFHAGKKDHPCSVVVILSGHDPVVVIAGIKGLRISVCLQIVPAGDIKGPHSRFPKSRQKQGNQNRNQHPDPVADPEKQRDKDQKNKFRQIKPCTGFPQQFCPIPIRCNIADQRLGHHHARGPESVEQETSRQKSPPGDPPAERQKKRAGDHQKRGKIAADPEIGLTSRRTGLSGPENPERKKKISQKNHRANRRGHNVRRPQLERKKNHHRFSQTGIRRAVQHVVPVEIPL